MKYILKKNIEYPIYDVEVHGELPWARPNNELVEIINNRKQHEHKGNTSLAVFVIVMLSMLLLSLIGPVINMLKDDLQFGLTVIGVTLLFASPIILGAVVIIRAFFQTNIKYRVNEQLNDKYAIGDYLIVKCEFLGIIKRNSGTNKATVKLPNGCCYIGDFDRLKEPTGEAYLVLIEYETDVINTEYIILF